MAIITDIKKRIQELSPAQFQEFCDVLIHKKGYGIVHGLGMQAGTGNTTKGNPDTYFRKDNGKYVFVAYTIEQGNIYNKLKKDINKCLDVTKTGLNPQNIDEIIICHTSSNLKAGDENQLYDFCKSKGISLQIWGIDEIANLVHNKYRSLANDYLSLSLDTNQIFSYDEFVEKYDQNGMSAPLNTVFQYREKEKKNIESLLNEAKVVIVTGKAGVGKTRLVLESIKHFSSDHNLTLRCVKDNKLDLYNDLVFTTENHGDYLFFVDDANEVDQLNLILDYITKKKTGYNVKIIMTVRDYVKGDVIVEVKKYTLPKIVEIGSFSDDEIKGFLNENLHILNERYIDQIIRIAEGNPRIAYMAGRLAFEKQNLNAIRDVSQLYDTYYSKYVNGSLGKDDKLCFTAGLLAIVKSVNLNELSVLNEIIGLYGMTQDMFIEKIKKLSSLEVVEIKLEKVAILSDQCLSNYMLYYVFFERKLVAFSDVIKFGYTNYRRHITKSLNTIFNIFSSDKVFDYFKKEILKVWKYFKDNSNSDYVHFVEDFHVLDPEESFLFVQSKLQNLKDGNFNPLSVDFKINEGSSDRDVLNFLTGYRNSNYLNYVMDLILEYCIKSEAFLKCGCSWLENNYGVDIESANFDYYTEVVISKYLASAIENGNQIAMIVGLKWASYSLGFNFQPIEMGRNNTIKFCNFNVTYSVGLKEYRSVCWNIMLILASNTLLKKRVMNFLYDYANHLYGDVDIELVKGDCEYVEKLLSEICCDDIDFFELINCLSNNINKLSLSIDEKWDSMLHGDLWELHQLLTFNYHNSNMEYEEYDETRKEAIIQYGKSLSTSKIKNFVQTANQLFTDLTKNRNNYYINEGINLIVDQFDVEKLKVFLDEFMRCGPNLDVNPTKILHMLNRKTDSSQLLESIKEAQFPQKMYWRYIFFDTLPEEKVNENMLNEFIIFLKDDVANVEKVAKYRNIKVLDKFLSIEPDIYRKICLYFALNYSSNPLIIGSYLSSLFDIRTYSLEKLNELFKGDLDFVSKIYFMLLRENHHLDYSSDYLVHFLSLGDSNIHRYSKILISYHFNDFSYAYLQIQSLWNSQNYINYFNTILYDLLKEDLYIWTFGNIFKELLVNREGNSFAVSQRQEQWVKLIVEENAFNDCIKDIFEGICELRDGIRIIAIKAFINVNQDYEIFKHLKLVPSHWSGVNSFVPAYQKQIDFYKSLFPLFTEMRFLKHKAFIKEKISYLENSIEKEKIDNIIDDMLM